MKCIKCILDEYTDKMKWSQVNDAVVTINGNSYCYEHFIKSKDFDKLNQPKEERKE